MVADVGHAGKEQGLHPGMVAIITSVQTFGDPGCLDDVERENYEYDRSQLH